MASSLDGGLRRKVSWLLNLEGDFNAQVDDGIAKIKAMGLSVTDTNARIKAYKEQRAAAAEADRVANQNLLGSVAAMGLLVAGFERGIAAVERWIGRVVEANQHLEKMGIKTGEAGDSINRYSQAVDSLSTSFDQLYVTLSGPLFKQLTETVVLLERISAYANSGGSSGLISTTTAANVATLGGYSLGMAAHQAEMAGLNGAMDLAGYPQGGSTGPLNFNAPTFGPLTPAEYLQQQRDKYWNGTRRDQWGNPISYETGIERWRQDAATAAQANIAMQGYYLSASPGTSLAAGSGFLGANNLNPYAGGSLGAGLSYNPMLAQPGLMGLQLQAPGSQWWRMMSMATSGVPADVSSLLANHPSNIAAALAGTSTSTPLLDPTTLGQLQAAAATLATPPRTPHPVTASGFASVLGGFGGGLASGLSALGPAGMAVGAVAGLAPHLGQTFDSLFSQADHLPAQLMRGLDHIIDRLPDIFTRLLPDLIYGLAQLIPNLVDALVVKLPAALAKAIHDAFLGGNGSGASPAAQSYFGRRGGSGLRGNDANQYLEDQAFFSSAGGAGLARGRGGSIHIHTHGSVPDQIRAIKKALGSYGNGYDLTPPVTH